MTGGAAGGLKLHALRIWLAPFVVIAAGGCPSTPQGPSVDPCDAPGTICTKIGTGQSFFNGDGNAALATGLYYPLGVTFGRHGETYFIDWNNLRIRQMKDDGTVQTYMGQDYEASPVPNALATETALHHASDFRLGLDGRYYVAGNHAPIVFVVDLDDRVHVVAGSGDFGYAGDGGPALEAKLNAPFGVWPTENGAFYLSDEAEHVVRYVDEAGLIRTVAGNGTRGYSGDGGPGDQAQLSNPTRVVLGPDGVLYICDTGNHSIRAVGPDGVISTFAGTGRLGSSGDGGPASEARLNTPYDLTFGPGGAMYIADTGNNVIRKVDPAGIVTTVVGSGAAGYAGDLGPASNCQLNRPSGVTLAPDGALWISDTYNNRVRRVAGFLEMN